MPICCTGSKLKINVKRFVTWSRGGCTTNSTNVSSVFDNSTTPGVAPET